MQKRDYVRPSKKKSNVNTSIIIAVVIAVLLSAASFLWVLKEKAPVESVERIKKPTKSEVIPSLPSDPEKGYSYIRDLQTREISIDDSEKALTERAQLSKKQQTLLEEKKLAELEQKKLEEQQLAEQQQQDEEPKTVVSETDEKVAKKLKEKELAEHLALEKRKLAESKKKHVTAGFGIQCGAFKNRDQADNMYARLSMAGFDAKVVTQSGWNRVMVGPLGDRQAAKEAMEKAKKVAECLVVGM
ncbi:SPOR domain-containing protein [Pasteurella skyensis]|uniref:SPOR domain-containing protein n=1 Tax=Phocoenobacter skyensis TaxID=97481 RepID=A0AAJ6NAW2_9PAST|nr:SPOR domain-containing protein [Pasteurella skyensis]MDP8161582.1 SPOR domain-containing protein [Pasteurella skyensis]MDP8173416.1 SPOR domain-containing protein [Pasteurella skyensis]MDP8175976.1 SPOR domain-containing protein [Pasteurella skyensis]MDP8177944.1 SPOR domain-containing protein [Pasteurella skyensis]MDP8182397.1 SPOR domain-containing protein [Pasteurella skyensis]